MDQSPGRANRPPARICIRRYLKLLDSRSKRRRRSLFPCWSLVHGFWRWVILDYLSMGHLGLMYLYTKVLLHQNAEHCGPYTITIMLITRGVYLKSFTLSGLSGSFHCGLVTPCGDIGWDQHWPRCWLVAWRHQSIHYDDVIMGAITSLITSLTIVYSTVYSDADQRKHQSSASLAFVRAIHRGPVNSPHKWPATRKMFPFDDVIMIWSNVDLSSVVSYGSHLRPISQAVFKILIPKRGSKTHPCKIINTYIREQWIY